MFSSTINGIESISFYTNSGVADWIDFSSKRLTSKMKASPARSLSSVYSRYFTRAGGKYMFEHS